MSDVGPMYGWEKMWSEEYVIPYWWNNRSGEATWEEPVVVKLKRKAVKAHEAQKKAKAEKAIKDKEEKDIQGWKAWGWQDWRGWQQHDWGGQQLAAARLGQQQRQRQQHQPA